MNTQIFRKYDIRGIAHLDLTDDVMARLGCAFASRLKATQPKQESFHVALGRDARASSRRLFTALTRGLRAQGVHVVDLGLVPTPVVYFSMFESDALDAAIQITGSHNPAEYNGLKMMMGRDTLYGDAIQELAILCERTPTVAQKQTKGSVREDDQILDRYLDWISHDMACKGSRRLKVVLDSGNGVAGVIAPLLVRKIFDADVVELFSEPDERFPNHHPDPTVEENLVHLQDAVAAHGADLGVAYDGDGDRLGVVDATGRIIWGDRLMILFARQVLAQHPGATIIGEVKCSQVLYEDIAAHGGVPIMSAVGHSLIKAKIRDTGAMLAGEMSGHIFFNDRYFGFDDAIYATCRLLEILSGTQSTLAELMDDVPVTFATPEIRVACDDAHKFKIPALVAAHYSASGCVIDTTDGARILFEGGAWALVRASNTQPVLVLRVEAKSALERDAILVRLRGVLDDVLFKRGNG